MRCYSGERYSSETSLHANDTRLAAPHECDVADERSYQREVVQAQKQRGMQVFQLREGDTGSSAVQVIALTTRIQQMQTHMSTMRQDWTVRSVCANRNHRIDRNGPFRWCLLARQLPTKSIVGDWQAQPPHVPGQYRYIDLEADTEET